MKAIDGIPRPSDSVLPLWRADGRKLGACTLALGDVRALRQSGWREFSLRLRDRRGSLRQEPLIQGIYSRGGKDGVKAWMDIEYREEVPSAEGPPPGSLLSLRDEGLDVELFRLLGEIIPPGGHVMVSYEGEQQVHRVTLGELAAGVPPAATPLGTLLFFGGFRHVKDWYLAEGGMEGPRKLWGEKAPDAAWERTFGEWTARELVSFLEGCRAPGPDNVMESPQRRAEAVLRTIPGTER